jgi:hypothetical protein
MVSSLQVISDKYLLPSQRYRCGALSNVCKILDARFLRNRSAICASLSLYCSSPKTEMDFGEVSFCRRLERLGEREGSVLRAGKGLGGNYTMQ